MRSKYFSFPGFVQRFGCNPLRFRSESEIFEAIVHVEVEDGGFAVLGIARPVAKGTEPKWFLFAKEDQKPSAHSMIEDKINKLRVKTCRNLPVEKRTLVPYLSEDRKSFAFKGVPLVEDKEKSIHEPVHVSDTEEPVAKKKKTNRTSTPRLKGLIAKSAKTSKQERSESKPSFGDFLKGHELVKKMKIKPFDPYQVGPADWISNFEKEFGQHASVEDLGFTYLLHLLKADDAKKWHFKYRLEYIDWLSFKKDSIQPNGNLLET